MPACARPHWLSFLPPWIRWKGTRKMNSRVACTPLQHPTIFSQPSHARLFTFVMLICLSFTNFACCFAKVAPNPSCGTTCSAKENYHDTVRTISFPFVPNCIRIEVRGTFGNLKHSFLSTKLIQKSNFRVQGIFFQQLYWEKSKQDTLWRRL